MACKTHEQITCAKSAESWPAARAIAPVALLLLVLLPLARLDAEDSQPLTSTPDILPPVSLEYRELPARVMGRQLSILPRTIPFPKEPELAGRKVGRGTILSAFYAGSPKFESNNCINISFLWDYRAGKLYLDLRGDGDLANAPVFFTTERPSVKLRSGNYFYQPFTNINLAFGHGSDRRPRLVDLHFYGYDGQNASGANLVWRCYWQGRLTLGGRDWQIGLVENPNHLGTAKDGYLLLRPWSERESPFSVEDGLLTGFECPTNLYFQDRAYQLKFDYISDAAPNYKLLLSEITPESGELLVQGQFIDRMILRNDEPTSPFTAVLDSAGLHARIPAGSYYLFGVCLKHNGTAAFRTYWRRQPLKVTIPPGATTNLAAGGPLTNWAVIEKHERALSIDYELRGADGTYRLATNDRANPARFAVYRAGEKLASGNFQYG